MPLRKRSLGSKSKSNCIVFALRRLFSRGGFIVLRTANYGWWLHLVWTKDFTTFEEFTPCVHIPNLSFPPLLFRGLIKTISREDQIANGLKAQTSKAVAFVKRLKIKLAVVDARRAGPPTEIVADEREKFANELNRLEHKIAENSRRIHIFDIDRKLAKGLKALAPKLIPQIKVKPRKLKSTPKH